jgi:AAA domain
MPAAADQTAHTVRPLVGPTGLGKTNLLLQIGLHVAAGEGFLHWQGRRVRRVLYVDGEMSRRLLKKRLAAAVHRLGHAPVGFHALSHEDIPGFAPLNTPEGQACVNAVIERIGGVDLAIFDSVMCLIAGKMKDEDAWAQTMPYIRKLTARGIGQLWGHHTGHDESRSYGDKTKEWQLDLVLFMETVRREDTDVSFNLEFRKAREREPETRADFQSLKVALVNDEWLHELSEAQHVGKASPLAQKFLDALVNVLASDMVTKVNGRRAATDDDWKVECTRLGLIDPEAKPASARTLFAKYRRELVAANRIACEGKLSWIL